MPVALSITAIWIIAVIVIAMIRLIGIIAALSILGVLSILSILLRLLLGIGLFIPFPVVFHIINLLSGLCPRLFSFMALL